MMKSEKEIKNELAIYESQILKLDSHWDEREFKQLQGRISSLRWVLK